MGRLMIVIPLVTILLLLLLTAVSYNSISSSHAAPSSRLSPSRAVCSGSGVAAEMLRENLGFCGNSGMSCCDAGDDAALREQFEDRMKKVSDADDTCAAIVKATLCAKCSPSLSPAGQQSNTTESFPLRCVAYLPSSSSTAHHNQNRATPPPPPKTDTLCLERIAEASYLNMAAHPDGSGRAFLSTQQGKVWLASVPGRRSRGAMRVAGDGATPFLDLSGQVHQLRGIAFHPQFATNGRFFVSYTCHTGNSLAYGGRCSACGPDPGNDSSNKHAAPAGNVSLTSYGRYQLVVSEFSAKAARVNSKSASAHADPSEVRRIFTLSLPVPQTSKTDEQQGGQILFRPRDNRHLYLISGHGGGEAKGRHSGPDDFSKTGSMSFLGKVIKFHVDGNVSREIFAMGLSNPRGCSFDSERPSYLYCADDVDEVGLVSRMNEPEGNYSGYFVVLGHSRRAVGGTTASIVGGLVYRGSADPWLKGRYLYMYGSAAWAAVEAPTSSRRYATSRIPNIACSRNTPLPCPPAAGRRVLSWSEDNSKEAFALASDGVYRVVEPSLCGPAPPPPQQPSTTPWPAWLLSFGVVALTVVVGVLYLATLLAAGDGLTVTSHIELFGSMMCCVSVTNNNNNYYAIAEHQA